MLTVLESIKKSTEYLEGKGIESPRMNAELLLANILNCKRLDLYLRFDSPLSKEEIDQYRDAIARRGKFEPLQYITGKVEFFDLELKVNKDVLIPRPETELLVEQAIDLGRRKNISTILDIGTGSGNIAIALAKHLNGVKVTSIDLSNEAVELAEENAVINEVNNKVNFMVADIFNFQPGQKYDMIISNPPYVSTQDYKTLQKEIVDYEPAIAVTDNFDGYKFYQHIVSQAQDLLNDDGILLFEVAKDQSERIKKIMIDNNYSLVRAMKDYQEIDRIVIGEKN